MLVFHIQSTDSTIEDEKVIFYFQDLLIGNSRKSHIKVPSVKRDTEILKITHQEEGVLVESLDSYPYFVNGKKVIGTKILKLEETLQANEFLITLKEADFTKANQMINLHDRYEFFHQNHDEYSTVITALERELILADD